MQVFGNLAFEQILLQPNQLRCTIYDNVKEDRHKRKSTMSVIPIGCTKFFYTQNIFVNKYFKSYTCELGKRRFQMHKNDNNVNHENITKQCKKRFIKIMNNNLQLCPLPPSPLQLNISEQYFNSYLGNINIYWIMWKYVLCTCFTLMSILFLLAIQEWLLFQGGFQLKIYVIFSVYHWTMPYQAIFSLFQKSEKGSA